MHMKEVFFFKVVFYCFPVYFFGLHLLLLLLFFFGLERYPCGHFDLVLWVLSY